MSLALRDNREGGAEVAEVAFTPGADRKSYRDVCQEYITVHVGEVIQMTSQMEVHIELQCFCCCQLHVQLTAGYGTS